MRRFIAAFAAVTVSAAGCVTGSPPALEPQQIPEAVAGRYYEVEFTVTGGDGGSIQSSGLPPGLEVFSGIGSALLFGTPQAEGSHTLMISAGSGGPTMFTRPARAERTYTLVVRPSSAADVGVLGFERAISLSATTGRPFTFDLCRDAIVDPFESPGPGTTPPADGCAAGAAVRGGQPPYRFQLYCVTRAELCDVTDGPDVYRIPDGFALTPDGVISGTPSSTGRWRFIVCAIDSLSARACGSVSTEIS